MFPKLYGKYALFYDSLYAYRPSKKHVSFISSVLSHFNISGRRILDIGCGTGTVAKLLSQEGFVVTGIDLNNAMLSIARKKAGDVIFIRANMLEFSSLVPFDVVYALFSVVNHVDNPENLYCLFKNSYSLLDKGGVFIFDIGYTPKNLLTIKPVSHSFKQGNLSVHTTLSVKHNFPDPKYDLILDFKIINDGVVSFDREVVSHCAFSFKEVKFVLEKVGFKVFFGDNSLSGVSSVPKSGFIVAVKN